MKPPFTRAPILCPGSKTSQLCHRRCDGEECFVASRVCAQLKMSLSDSETASENEPDHRSCKRRKVESHNNSDQSYVERQRPISPPVLRRVNGGGRSEATLSRTSSCAKAEVLPSPFRLTHIRDLPSHLNVDAVKLSDILGDPLIKECWQFNFLIDLDFLM